MVFALLHITETHIKHENIPGCGTEISATQQAQHSTFLSLLFHYVSFLQKNLLSGQP
jgi:hypothetical protein